MRLLRYKISPLDRGAEQSEGGVCNHSLIRLLAHSLIAILFATVLLSCNKDDEPTPPVINLLSMSKDTLVQFQDSLDILIKYTDMDGDVGEVDADSNALYIKDSRLPAADYYHVQPLSPPNTQLNIQGQFTVKIKNMFLLGNGGNETAYFTIKLKDQAGNWSNEIITPQVLITQ